MKSFVCPAVLAAVASGMTSYTKITTNDIYVGGIGPVEGYTYPQMGGPRGDLVQMGGYTTANEFLAAFDSTGKGFVGGLNSSTLSPAGNLLGFGDFSVSSAHHPAGVPVTTFVSSVSSEDGIFVELPSGEIATIVTTNTTFGPAGGEAFNYLAQPNVEISQDQSTVYVAFAARAGYTWRGILLANLPVGGGDVSLDLVVDTSVTIPNTDVNFVCISNPKVTTTGTVMFFGSHCGHSSASSMVEQQFNNNMLYKSEPVLKHALTGNRQVGVGSVHPGLWQAQGGKITEIVDENTQIPGGVSGESFAAFSDAGVGYDGTVAFVGLGTNGSYGLYKRSPGASGLTMVVNNQVDVPGYSNCPFRNIPQVPSVDADGNVVFFGLCDSKTAGVFAETSSGLGTLLTYDDKVNGYSTIYVGHGTNAVSGSKAAVYIVLDDPSVTSGIWIFDIPAVEAKTRYQLLKMALFQKLFASV